MAYDVNSLLQKYDSTILAYKKLIFLGVGDKDVYNITSPFFIKDKEYIAARVEPRENELSKVMFFQRINETTFTLDPLAPIFDLQDPSITFINNQLILIAVQVLGSKYRTVFLKGTDIYDLKIFAHGPFGMKDIRIMQLNNNIIMFTRPQGKIGGRGRIAFTFLKNLDELAKFQDKDYFSAQLINGDFLDEEWLGVNATYVLDNQLLILGHIANFNNENKNYYPILFMFDPSANTISKIKILAKRNDLPEGPSKRPELKNIMFSGGLSRQENNTVKFYTGVSDAEAYEITIKDPFLEI